MFTFTAIAVTETLRKIDRFLNIIRNCHDYRQTLESSSLPTYNTYNLCVL